MYTYRTTHFLLQFENIPVNITIMPMCRGSQDVIKMFYESLGNHEHEIENLVQSKYIDETQY